MKKIKEYRSPEQIQAARKCCRFYNKPVLLCTEEGSKEQYPCIVLMDIRYDLQLLVTDFDVYLYNLIEAEEKKETTRNLKAYYVCAFLNFLLWHTELNRIEEVTVKVVRNFLIFYKRLPDGKERGASDWKECRKSVFTFLIDFWDVHHEYAVFAYKPEQLIQCQEALRGDDGKMITVPKYSGFNIKPPKKVRQKNRVLMRGYLDLLLLEAQKYAPDLVLPIALQSYAGLREGEVVNLKRDSIKVRYGGYGRISQIEIDLSSDAEFNFHRTGSTPTGSIKKQRKQLVYDDFLEKIIEYRDKHELLMDLQHGVSKPGDPLCKNKWGKPLTVKNYCDRVKKLFYDHFLPVLRKTCEMDGTWEDNAPYIEMYEEDYPGAHMFRHWFTMYLLTEAKLTLGEIQKWRGDSSPLSMQEYIHENGDMIEAYKMSAYTLQAWMLDGGEYGY